MVNQADRIEVRFNRPPDSNTTICLLHEICRQKPVYSPRVVDKPLILYGAGNLGKMAREYFQKIGVPFLFVVDTNPDAYKNDVFWEDVDVFKPDDVGIEYKQNALLAVCVATVPYSPLHDFLRSSNWSDFVPFYDIAEAYRAVHPLSNGWFSGLLNAEDIISIEKVLCAWTDDISRAHHLQFIAWRYLRQEWVFKGAPVTTSDRFFIPQVASVLTDKETLLDIGAYHGNTTIKFLEVVDNKFNAIWAIEPDGSNVATLRWNLAPFVSDYGSRIKVLQMAVDSQPGESLFCEGFGYASQLSCIGEQSIRVQTIDGLELEPSYIKLHLEGAELNALQGAQATIHRNRPIITATTYHNALGLWELPLWLMQITHDYRFYLRLHSWCGTGSVIYCVPEERFTC